MKKGFLNFTIRTQMRCVWIFIFMHFHFASSAETITGTLFRKIPVQEFRNGVGIGGRTKLQTSHIVNIFQALCQPFHLIMFSRNVELPALKSHSAPVLNMMQAEKITDFLITNKQILIQSTTKICAIGDWHVEDFLSSETDNCYQRDDGKGILNLKCITLYYIPTADRTSIAKFL